MGRMFRMLLKYGYKCERIQNYYFFSRYDKFQHYIEHTIIVLYQ